MAMNIRMKISFLLLLSFSILLGHNLVPHHHHAEVMERTIDDDCPVEHNDHHGDENEPVHCHAFNAHSFYKVSGQDITQKWKVISAVVILFPEIEDENPNGFETCRIKSSEAPVVLPGIYGSTTTRGPPIFI